MLKTLFLAPGRLAAKLFKDKKRRYRSLRSKASASPGVIFASLFFWFLAAAGLMLAVDKSGLLNKALDVGLDAAQNAGVVQAPEESAAPAGEGAAAPAGNQEAAPPESAAGQPGDPAPPGEGRTETPASPAGAETAEAERWLVILHTIPKSARDEAERRQNQYSARGLQVEIMDTDAFPRLVGGSWIIAQGPFDDRASAQEAAEKARPFNAGLMVRRGL